MKSPGNHQDRGHGSLKVLLVNKFYFPLGGPETCLFQQEELLRRKGHSVVVFSTRDPRNKQCEQSPFFIEKIDYNRSDIPLGQKVKFGLRLLYSSDAAKKMDALLCQERPDIAHLHNICHQISPSILPVLKRHGIPIVQTLHDLKLVCPSYKMLSPKGICERCRGGRYYHVVLQRCVKGSVSFGALNCLEAYFHRVIRVYDLVDLFISPSAFYREKLISFGVDGRRIRVLPNFIGEGQTASPDSGGYVLYCGQLVRQKGVRTLVKSVRGERSVKLRLAGSGPEEPALRRFLSENRMTNVQLLGFVAGEEREKLMQGASFFVLPSEWYENCPLVVLEAFAYGKPVIAARIGGIPELVKPGYNGLLFEPGNAAELREKIRFLLSNPREALRMGENARKTAEKEYSPQVHYRNLMAIYEEVMARQRTLAPDKKPSRSA